jgi:hypothetical protein
MPNRLDAEAAELIETTLPARMEAENTAILRSRRSLQRLENKGRIQLNCSGSEFQWSVLRNELTAVPYVSGMVDYDPYQLHQGAVIGRRGYIKGVSIHKYDKLMNRGKEQIVDMWKGQINASLASVRRGIQGALYENGDGLDSYEGLETIFEKYATPVVADIIARPGDTYAGLSTNPGSVGGTWTTALTTKPNAALLYDWPDGTGDALFDHWSPIMCNWSSTSWPSGSSNTFPSTCEYVLSRMLQWLQLSRGMEGAPDTVILAPALYTDFKNAIRADRIWPVDAGDKVDFGLGPAINYEGMLCWTEYGVPANTLYMYRTEDVDLLCLESALITRNGPWFDEGNFTWKFAADAPGNFRFKNPRNFAKAYNYAAA